MIAYFRAFSIESQGHRYCATLSTDFSSAPTYAPNASYFPLFQATPLYDQDMYLAIYWQLPTQKKMFHCKQEQEVSLLLEKIGKHLHTKLSTTHATIHSLVFGVVKSHFASVQGTVQYS